MEEQVPVLVACPERETRQVGWFAILLAVVLLFNLFSYFSSWGEDPDLGVKLQVSGEAGVVNIVADF